MEPTFKRKIEHILKVVLEQTIHIHTHTHTKLIDRRLKAAKRNSKYCVHNDI